MTTLPSGWVPVDARLDDFGACSDRPGVRLIEIVDLERDLLALADLDAKGVAVEPSRGGGIAD